MKSTSVQRHNASTHRSSFHRHVSGWRRTLIVLLAIPATGAFLAQAQIAPAPAELPQTKVGDRWKFETRDKLTGAMVGVNDYKVTAVSGTQIDLAVGTDGKATWTPELNPLDHPRLSWDPGYRWLTFPLGLDRAWDFKSTFKRKDGAGSGRTQMDVTVKALEKVTVRAGEFDAYRIEGTGYMNGEGTNGNWNSRVAVKYWYAPSVRAMVKFEWEDKFNRTVSELVEVQLAQ